MAVATRPSELHIVLSQALHQFEASAVSKPIAEIGENVARLADSLKTLADEFEYDRILDLVQGSGYVNEKQS